MLAWPIGLLVWANGKVQHVDALSGAAATPGTTYLHAGSDSRADGTNGNDGTQSEPIVPALATRNARLDLYCVGTWLDSP